MLVGWIFRLLDASPRIRGILNTTHPSLSSNISCHARVSYINQTFSVEDVLIWIDTYPFSKAAMIASFGFRSSSGFQTEYCDIHVSLPSTPNSGTPGQRRPTIVVQTLFD